MSVMRALYWLEETVKEHVSVMEHGQALKYHALREVRAVIDLK